jgi:dTDP-4-dehydrorhamnose 3,5-epimerase
VPLIPFESTPTAIDGLLVVTPKQVSDPRGTVRELFRLTTFASLEPTAISRCAQVNLTETKRGAIRGLHGEAMTKLVGVVAGEAFGAYVDARPASATFRRVVTLELTVGLQVLVPQGVLNGMQATGPEGCQYLYCFDQEWRPDMPGIAAHPLDSDLAIAWPITVDPTDRGLLSEKDAGNPPFSVLF